MMMLPLGAVVRKKDDAAHRGVVIWSNGRGIRGDLRIFSTDTYVIERAPGLHSIGDAADWWEVVPREEATAYERVIGASAAWEPPTWADEDGINDCDSYAFAVMSALFSEAEHERVFGEGNWPVDFLGLAKTVARWIDHSLAASRTLGSAMARISE